MNAILNSNLLTFWEINISHTYSENGFPFDFPIVKIFLKLFYSSASPMCPSFILQWLIFLSIGYWLPSYSVWLLNLSSFVPSFFKFHCRNSHKCLISTDLFYFIPGFVFLYFYYFFF